MKNLAKIGKKWVYGTHLVVFGPLFFMDVSHKKSSNCKGLRGVWDTFPLFLYTNAKKNIYKYI